MRLSSTHTLVLAFVPSFIVLSIGVPEGSAQSKPSSRTEGGSQSCPKGDSGLKLPSGFCATVFADDIGHARHMVVAPNGVLYVNTWSGRYYGNDTPHAGGFLVALQDKSSSGKADVIERFGETVETGGKGGTGIGLFKGSVFAEINDPAAWCHRSLGKAKHISTNRPASL